MSVNCTNSRVIWGGVISDSSSDSEDEIILANLASTGTSTKYSDQNRLVAVEQQLTTVTSVREPFDEPCCNYSSICNDLEIPLDVNANYFTADQLLTSSNHNCWEKVDTVIGEVHSEVSAANSHFEHVSNPVPSLIDANISEQPKDNKEQGNKKLLHCSTMLDSALDFNANEVACKTEREVVCLSDDADSDEEKAGKKLERFEIVLAEANRRSLEEPKRHDEHVKKRKRNITPMKKSVIDRETKITTINKAQMTEKALLKPSKYIGGKRVSNECFEKLYVNRKKELMKQLDKMKTCDICQLTFKSFDRKIKHEIKEHALTTKPAPRSNMTLNDEGKPSKSTPSKSTQIKISNVSQKVVVPKVAESVTFRKSWDDDVVAIFKCKGCQFEFSSEHQMRNHFTIVHVRSGVDQCNHCNLKCDQLNQKSSGTAYWLSTYASIKYLQRCTICGIVFYNNKNALKRHITTHANDGNFKCNFCESFDEVKSHVLEQECWLRGRSSCVLLCVIEQKMTKSFFRQSSAICVSANITQLDHIRQQIQLRLSELSRRVVQKRVPIPPCKCSQMVGNKQKYGGHGKQCRYRRISCHGCGKKMQFHYLEMHKSRFCRIPNDENNSEQCDDSTTTDSNLVVADKRAFTPSCNCSQLNSSEQGNDGHSKWCKYRRINCPQCGKEMQFHYLESHKKRFVCARIMNSSRVEQNDATTKSSILSITRKASETAAASSDEESETLQTLAKRVRKTSNCGSSELPIDEMVASAEYQTCIKTNLDSNQFGDQFSSLMQNDEIKAENVNAFEKLQETTMPYSLAQISVSKVISLAYKVEV